MSRRATMLFGLASLLLAVTLGSLTRSENRNAPNDSGRKPAQRAFSDQDYELFRALADTVEEIERNYVKEVSRRELIEAAIAGMLTKLDQHSGYISPDEIARFRTSVESQFAGIGIHVSQEQGQLRVVSPLYGTPAYRAGLRAGDQIVSIDGKTTKSMSLDQAVAALKGEPGSKVALSLLRAGSPEPFERTLTREVVHVETVLGDHRQADNRWAYMLDDDERIGYVRLTTFSRETPRDLRKVLDDLVASRLQGLVLDLRFNPGGLLSSAIEVADMFVDEGRIVSTQGRSVAEQVWEARKKGTYLGFPIVVLVNRYSASASEIVAACLQDHGRAVIVGERTWGKGSVQNVIELEAGRSALKLTTSSYQRPSGKNIHRFPEDGEEAEWGVRPNRGYEVKFSDRETAELFDSYQRREKVLGKPQTDLSGAQAATEPATGRITAQRPRGAAGKFTDRQLERALRHLSSKLASAR